MHQACHMPGEQRGAGYHRALNACPTPGLWSTQQSFEAMAMMPDAC